MDVGSVALKKRQLTANFLGSSQTGERPKELRLYVNGKLKKRDRKAPYKFSHSLKAKNGIVSGSIFFRAVMNDGRIYDIPIDLPGVPHEVRKVKVQFRMN